MLADVVTQVVEAIRDVDGVVTLTRPDRERPHLLRVVASRPPTRVAGDVIESVDRCGVRLRYLVYGPAPVPWVRIYVLDGAHEQYTISITFTWG